MTVVTGEQIAERAYYIWADGSGAGAFDDWIRAERELAAAGEASTKPTQNRHTTVRERG